MNIFSIFGPLADLHSTEGPDLRYAELCSSRPATGATASLRAAAAPALAQLLLPIRERCHPRRPHSRDPQNLLLLESTLGSQRALRSKKSIPIENFNPGLKFSIPIEISISIEDFNPAVFLFTGPSWCY